MDGLLRPLHRRGVAQLGRALGSGPRGRRFKSCHPDQPCENGACEGAVFTCGAGGQGPPPLASGRPRLCGRSRTARASTQPAERPRRSPSPPGAAWHVRRSRRGQAWPVLDATTAPRSRVRRLARFARLVVLAAARAFFFAWWCSLPLALVFLRAWWCSLPFSVSGHGLPE
jgi:hypothetical protein